MQTTKKIITVMLDAYPIANADDEPVFNVFDAKINPAPALEPAKRYRVKIEVEDYPVGDYSDLRAKAKFEKEVPAR
jgi:hypothetical protein